MQIRETQCFLRDQGEAGVLIQTVLELKRICTNNRTDTSLFEESTRDRRVAAVRGKDHSSGRGRIRNDRHPQLAWLEAAHFRQMSGHPGEFLEIDPQVRPS